MAFNRPDILPQFGGAYGADPLGIALQDRAMRQRQEQHLAEMEGDINHRMIGGPLPSPAMEGLLQAMAERGVRRAGLGGGTAALASTADPSFQQPINMNSTNIASPFHGQSLDQRADLGRHLLPGYGGPDQAVAALRQTTPGGYQTNDEWMADQEPGQWAIRQSTTPGGGQRRGARLRVENSPLNQFQRYQQPNPNE